MKPSKSLVSSLVLVLLIVGLMTAWSANPVPSQLNQPFQGIGARAMGMGNAYVAVADDATAAAWNPAGIRQMKTFDLKFGMVQKTNNLDTQDIGDLADAAKNLDSIDKINKVLDITNRMSANGPVSLQVTPHVGVGLFGLAVIGYGSVQGNATITQNIGKTLTPAIAASMIASLTTPKVSVDAAGLVQANLGIGMAHNLTPALTLGAVIKQVNTKYRTYNQAATVDATLKVTQTSNLSSTSDESKGSMDLGMLYHFPDMEGMTFGAVARNINEPTFFSGTANEYTLKRQIDAGVAFAKPDLIVAMELHNLTSSNNGGMTVNLGVEKRVFSLFKLRAGLEGGDWTSGLGFKLGPASIDLAISSHLKTYSSASMSIAF